MYPLQIGLDPRTRDHGHAWHLLAAGDGADTR